MPKSLAELRQIAVRVRRGIIEMTVQPAPKGCLVPGEQSEIPWHGAQGRSSRAGFAGIAVEDPKGVQK